MDWKSRLLGWGVIAILVGVPAIFFWMRKAAPRALQRIYEEADRQETKSPERVQIRFHTYWGFLAFFTQQEHRVELPADTAEFMLGRLHAFNLKWGFFAAGAAFIPILSWFNYHSQLKRIRSVSQRSQSMARESGCVSDVELKR